jgi:hypothetical protein
MKTLIATLIVLFSVSALADHGIKRGCGGHCKNAQDPAKCEEREAKLEAAKEGCKAAADREACVADAVCGKGEHARCKEQVAKRLK